VADQTQQQEVNFSFVTDDRIREVLEDYWRQAHAANKAGVYAAVVVLCGGVLEGLLAWAISRKEEEARKQQAAKSTTLLFSRIYGPVYVHRESDHRI